MGGSYEEELQDMADDAEREARLKEDATTSAMNKIISTSFHMVHLINFFTSGPDEVRAWTIGKGWKAPQAAGVIHTDFERGFIRAETMSYADLVESGDEQTAKSKGLMRSEGKDYVVEEG